MHTSIRHGLFLEPLASARPGASQGDTAQWAWLALVALLVASVLALGAGITRAGAPPDLAAAAPEQPAGWGR